MINKVFFLAILFFMVGEAFSQLANIGTLKVNANTLLYTSDGVNMSNSGAGAVTNDGNIRVGGDFAPGTVATNFVNTYTSGSNYGQLIVRSASTIDASQKITQRTTIQQKSVTPFSQIGFPFKAYNVNEFLASLGLTSTTYSTITCSLSFWDPNVCFGLRKFYNQNALYYFNNNFLTYEPVVEEMLLNNFDISNGKRIVLNNITNNFFDATTTNTAVRNITGTPENRVITPHSEIPFNPYSSAQFVGAFYTGLNPRAQSWESLFEDPYRPAPSVNRFRHIYQFANPYPSNIDLSYIGITGSNRDTDGMAIDILGVSVIDTGSPVTLIGGVYSFTTKNATFITTVGPTKGRLQTGDVEALLIRPYGAFAIFGNSAAVTAFNFNDGLKSFSGVPRALDADGNGVVGDNDVDDNPLTVGTSFGSAKRYRESSYPDMSNISIGFQVYDDENDQHGSEAVYVFANESISNNYIFNDNFDINTLSQNNVLYTLKTDRYGNRVDGVADFNYKYKAQSVKMNEYRKIPLGFKSPVNGDGKYIIKTGKHRQIRYGGDDSAFPALFTFIDEKLGKSIPITTDFSYEFNQDADTENRFYIVYKNKAVDESGNSPVVTNTQIGKETGSNDNYLVLGSDVTVDNPNIQVYSAAGQLLDTFSSNGEKKIKLKNYAPGVYFIKVDGLKIAIKLISFNY